MSQGLKEGFEKFVIRKEGCWDWSGCCPVNPGYPQFRSNMKLWRAHRASWIIHLSLSFSGWKPGALALGGNPVSVLYCYLLYESLSHCGNTMVVQHGMRSCLSYRRLLSGVGMPILMSADGTASGNRAKTLV